MTVFASIAFASYSVGRLRRRKTNNILSMYCRIFEEHLALSSVQQALSPQRFICQFFALLEGITVYKQPPLSLHMVSYSIHSKPRYFASHLKVIIMDAHTQWKLQEIQQLCTKLLRLYIGWYDYPKLVWLMPHIAMHDCVQQTQV